MIHARWEAPPADDDFIRDEGRLAITFLVLSGGGGLLLIGLALGLWHLKAVALRPPPVVGIAAGQVFTAPPDPTSRLRETDFDGQFRDTVTVLFTRTERGPAPLITEFCAREVLAQVERDYREAAARYPAGFAQTLTLLEARELEHRSGLRRWFFRGILSARSEAAARLAAVYLEATFALAGSTPANPAGWRLVRLQARSRDDFFHDEVEGRRREALGLEP